MLLPNASALTGLRPRSRLLTLSGLVLALGLSLPAAAQDGGDEPPPRLGPAGTPGGPPPGGAPDDEDAPPERPASEGRQKPPVVNSRAKVTIDFVDTSVSDLIKYMAEITGRNFILTDKMDTKVTIISHQPVSVDAAYEAFLSALEMAGFTTVTTGSTTKVIATGEAGKNPLRVNEGGDIPATDNYVTQMITLENVSTSDLSSVVSELAGKSARVIAYAPANMFIITDTGSNIRRIYRIITQLDVASPKSHMEIVTLQNAQASEVKSIISELYGITGSSTTAAASSAGADRPTSRRRRRADAESEAPAATGGTTTAGAEGKFIEKVIADERTNSLILMANDEAMTAVKDLIRQLDVDVDPASRAQIHVVYLEHAKAEDVAQVLSQLSESGSSSSKSSSASSRSRQSGTTQGGRNQPGGARGGEPADADVGGSSSGSAVAAFDSGLRVTSDENTNSLVIIATPDQFAILKQVIDKLDIRRKQVFVEAVVLEMASEDDFSVGASAHLGKPNADGSLSVLGTQVGPSTLLGLSSDLLTGLAMGVFGEEIPVTVDGTEYNVPAFGIALQALQSNSAVNIVSTPQIMTLDNEEAKIVVGRNVPFPSMTSRDANNNPIVSYTREDVAITLKVTPQINESNYVTLEVYQEVTEVENSADAESVAESGPTTSKRQAETTVLVRDNQTVVIGGLIGSTDTEIETKVPLLGDLPLIGALFRSKSQSSRKTNLLIFLTPHVISDPADLEEVLRIKVAQRQEYLRRFYGKSKDDQEEALAELLQYSMNQVDKPSAWRTKADTGSNTTTIGTIDEAPAAEPEAAPEPTIELLEEEE